MTRARTALPPTQVLITGPYMLIEPPLHGLQEELIASRVVPELQADGSVQCRLLRTTLVETIANGKRQAGFPGDAEIAKRRAEATGRIVEVRTTFLSLPPPANQRYTDPGLIAFVAGHERGIVVYDPQGHVRQIDLLVQIAEA